MTNTTPADRAQSGHAGGYSWRFRRGATLVEPHVAHRRSGRAGAAGGDCAPEYGALLPLSRRIRSLRRHLDKALERCQLFNLVARAARLLETYGNLYRERGEVERATEYYERAARAYDEVGISLDRTELLEERALLSLQVGDLHLRRNLIDRLISRRSDERDALPIYTASLTRARVMIAQAKDYETARDELANALQYFHDHRLYYYEAQASMAQATCESTLGKNLSAREFAPGRRSGAALRLRVLAATRSTRNAGALCQ